MNTGTKRSFQPASTAPAKKARKGEKNHSNVVGWKDLAKDPASWDLVINEYLNPELVDVASGSKLLLKTPIVTVHASGVYGLGRWTSNSKPQCYDASFWLFVKGFPQPGTWRDNVTTAVVKDLREFHEWMEKVFTPKIVLRYCQLIEGIKVSGDMKTVPTWQAEIARRDNDQSLEDYMPQVMKMCKGFFKKLNEDGGPDPWNNEFLPMRRDCFFTIKGEKKPSSRTCGYQPEIKNPQTNDQLRALIADIENKLPVKYVFPRIVDMHHNPVEVRTDDNGGIDYTHDRVPPKSAVRLVISPKFTTTQQGAIALGLEMNDIMRYYEGPDYQRQANVGESDDIDELLVAQIEKGAHGDNSASQTGNEEGTGAHGNNGASQTGNEEGTGTHGNNGASQDYNEAYINEQNDIAASMGVFS